MAGITSFFKPVSKKPVEEGTQRKKRTIQISDDDDDDDFVAQPAKKKVKEQVNPSQFFGDKKANGNASSTPKKKAPVKYEDDNDIVMIDTPKATPKKSTATTSTASAKTKAPAKAKPTASKAKSISKAKKKNNDNDDDDDFTPTKDTEEDSTTTTEEKAPAKKSGFYNMMHRAPPSALGSRPKPVGKDGCLTDMAFVLSGEFETLTKDNIKDIIKTYGGRITTSVSGKTTHLLRGRDAGQSKIEKAKSLGTKVLDEDGFYSLVENSAEQKQSSMAPIETVKPKPAVSKGKAPATTPRSSTSSSLSAGKKTTADVDLLWTEKYKPTRSADIIGNKSNIERVSKWLAEWQDNRRKNFPDSGDELQSKRAVLLSGPPGIGKTTTAQILAKEHGYTALEFNASDTRSKKVLEELVTETTFNRSMTEFFSGGPPGTAAKIKKPNSVDGKLVLIMDEVDGMSGGDRGGSAELARLIRSTKVPIICICNDSRSDKVKPLLKVCYEAKFIRTPAKNMRAKLMKIAFSEKLRIEANAVDELVALTGNDIRQVINILSTYRLSSDEMKYGDAKIIGTHNQKYSQISLFDIPLKLLGSSGWQFPNMNQLADIYFHDYALANLMVFENYAKVQPNKSQRWNKTGNPKETSCLEMDLLAKAANAIAEGDLVDNRIGTKQEYSLMPVHSIFSCVRPSYYMEGSFAGTRINFPSWLGQNSKTTKNKRLLANIQNKVRSRATVDLSEVRQHYIPALTCNVFNDISNGDYNKAMDTMDFYYMDRENLETLSDLALTPKPVMSTLNAATKRNFNKQYVYAFLVIIVLIIDFDFVHRYKARSHPSLFELSDTTPLKSKSKAPTEDLEGTIFDVEPEAGDLSDDEE
ncbi:unnamed protein product [Absidia cylindrospora]